MFPEAPDSIFCDDLKNGEYADTSPEYDTYNADPALGSVTVDSVVDETSTDSGSYLISCSRALDTGEPDGTDVVIPLGEDYNIHYVYYPDILFDNDNYSYGTFTVVFTSGEVFEFSGAYTLATSLAAFGALLSLF